MKTREACQSSELDSTIGGSGMSTTEAEGLPPKGKAGFHEDIGTILNDRSSERHSEHLVSRHLFTGVKTTSNLGEEIGKAERRRG